MIQLNVENYCQECPDFDPVTERLYAGGEVAMTSVLCKYDERCKRIKRYLEEESKEN